MTQGGPMNWTIKFNYISWFLLLFILNLKIAHTTHYKLKGTMLCGSIKQFIYKLYKLCLKNKASMKIKKHNNSLKIQKK